MEQYDSIEDFFRKMSEHYRNKAEQAHIRANLWLVAVFASAILLMIMCATMFL